MRKMMMAVAAAVMASAMWMPAMAVASEGKKFGKRYVAMARGY